MSKALNKLELMDVTKMTKKGDNLLGAIKSKTLWRAMIANVSSEHNIKEELVLPHTYIH